MRGAELRRALARELAAAGLLPEADAFRLVASRIRAAGTAERRRLDGVLGVDGWRRLQRPLARERPEEDCVRLLGCGSELTRFAIAPVGLDRRSADAVASLGADVNLIVALFDRITESGTPVADVLPPAALERAMDGGSGGDEAALLEPLVESYFARLRKLPAATCDAALVDQLRRCVLEMYDAEVRTLTRGHAVASEVLQKKNTLPFIVAGLPAWLAGPGPRHRRAQHLRWLHALGLFLGRIDDAADLDEDAANGHPNELLGPAAEPDPNAAARVIAREGRDVLSGWTALSPPNADDLAVFKVTVASWLEVSAREATDLAEPRPPAAGAWT
jgi:hypothetical protein